MAAPSSTKTIELQHGYGWKIVLHESYSVFTNITTIEHEFLVVDQDKDSMFTFSLTDDSFTCIQSVYGSNYTVEFGAKTITLHNTPDFE